MSGQVFGQAYISVNGELLPSLPGAQLDLGGVERAPVEGDNQVLGFTQKPKAAMLTVDVALKAGMSVAALQNTVDATINFECDSGQVYVVRGAFVTKTLSITGGDNGKVSLEFAGMPAEELSL